MSSLDPKILRKEAITSTPIADVWSVWTTIDGIISFLAPKANIKLEVQGPYEILFDPESPLGFKGTEGCRILGFDPMKTMSVEWKAPPQFPNVRRQKTRVDIHFERVEALTKVTWRECNKDSLPAPLTGESPMFQPGLDNASPESAITSPSKRTSIAFAGTLETRVSPSASFIQNGMRSHDDPIMSDDIYMPGATTVGLVCKEGAILGSERRYAYGTFVMSKVAKKVFKITDKIGVGCAGIIGDMQVLSREALAYMSIFEYERGRAGTVKNTAKLMANLLSARRFMPYLAQTIIAGVDNSVPSLFVMDPIGSVLEDKFAAVGTGAEVAMGVLESEYREGLSVDEARPLILRAIRSALARDISSGDGVDLLVITESGIKEESHKLVKEKNE